MSLHIALIEPRIPPNTGNIARLCAAADVPLHLIGPLGFLLDDRAVRRAGLDYWDKVDIWQHANWFEFRDAIARERCLYFSANAANPLREAPISRNSVLIFGNETDGLPARILEKHPDRCFRIPMPGEVRSLNLANAVSVVLYEGLRRLGEERELPDIGAGEVTEEDVDEVTEPASMSSAPDESAPPARRRSLRGTRSRRRT